MELDKHSKIVVNGSVKVDCKTSFNTELMGKKFTVLPATMMVEGSYQPYVESLEDQSSLYFSATELRQSVDSWNGRPVSLNHPEGQGTCNSPKNYDKQWVGYIFNTKYDSSAKGLKAELWIDDKRGKFISNRVANGDHIEVSIGAFGDLEPNTNKDVGSGESYDYRMTNILGDHLAVLPDGIGACGWKDGCGIRAAAYVNKNIENKKLPDVEHIVVAVRPTARAPSYDGIEESSWAAVNKSFKAYVAGYYEYSGAKRDGDPPNNISDAPMAMKRWIASKTLLGDPAARAVRGLIFFPVVNPKTNRLNSGALRAVLSGRGEQADIPESARESAQKKASSLLKSKFKKKVEGIAMTDCKEKTEAKVEMAEAKADVEIKNNKFDMKQWLNAVPEADRKYLINSMKSYEEAREKSVGKILSCKTVSFCKEALSRVEDVSLLDNIASLVDAAENKKDEHVAKTSDYQLRVAAEKAPETGYAQFRDITWNN